MYNIEIMPSPMNNLEEVSLFIEENEKIDISKEEYKVKKDMFSDFKKITIGTTYFLCLSASTPFIPETGFNISQEQMVYDYEEHISLLQEIEYELNTLSTPMVKFEELIDGDEIKEEIEIIS